MGARDLIIDLITVFVVGVVATWVAGIIKPLGLKIIFIIVVVLGLIELRIKPGALRLSIRWVYSKATESWRIRVIHIPLPILFTVGLLCFFGFQFLTRDKSPNGKLIVAICNFHPVSGAEEEDNNALISHLQDSLWVYKNDIILLDSVYPEVRDSIQARKLGESKGAHVVIWGSIEKTKIEAEIIPRITIVKRLGKMQLEARQPQPALGVSIAELEEIEFRQRKAREIADVTLFIFGLAKYWGKKYEEARAILENIQYKTAEVFFYIGNCYFKRPQPNYLKAANAYEMTSRLDSACALTYSNWGAVLMKSDRCDEAIDKFEKGVAIDSNRAEVWVNWGATLGKTGKYGEAIEKLERADKLMPNCVEIIVNLGSALALSGRYSEAEGKFEQAILIDPNYAEAYSNWGATLYISGRYEDAIKKFKKAVKINPEYVDAYFNWGLTLMKLEEYDDAIKIFRKVVNIDPHYGEAFFKCGIALGKLDRNEEAAEQFEQAATINPNNAETFYNWGVALDNQAMHLDNSGNHIEARKKYEEAITKYKETVRLDSNYVSAYLNLVADLNELGRWREAIKISFKLLSLSPNNAEGYANLGVALMNSNQKTQARWAFSMAVELFKKQEKYEDAKKVEALLKKLEE